VTRYESYPDLHDATLIAYAHAVVDEWFDRVAPEVLIDFWDAVGIHVMP
jgi:hypothetical protein